MKKITLVTLLALSSSVAFADSKKFVESETTISFPSVSVGAKDPKGNHIVSWIGLSLKDAKGTTVSQPTNGAPSWELKFRRYLTATNSAGVIALPFQLSLDERKLTDLAKIDAVRKKRFDELKVAPDAGYIADCASCDPDTVFGPAPSDNYSENLFTWAKYESGLNHLMNPANGVFVIHTSDDHYAKVQLVSYQSDGEQVCWRAVGNGPAEKYRGEANSCTVVDPAKGSSVNDKLTHLRLRWKYNTVAGDKSLE